MTEAGPKKSTAKRRRKKRKRKKASPGEGLARLKQAFDAGNFAYIRREAQAVADASEDKAARDAALDLRRRIEPGRGSIMLWTLGVALMVLLYSYYWVSQHGG